MITTSLDGPAAGRPLRVVLVAFYNYQSHALRIFHPLLARRGHDVHSIFFKNYFTYNTPSARDEDLVVDLIARLKPDIVGMSVWSTYYQLAARVTRRVRAAVNPVVIWGGIHAQTCPEDCLADADIVCRSEGEHVLVELTDRIGRNEDYRDLHGCWLRTPGGDIVRNPPRPLIPDLDVLPPADLTARNKYYLGFDTWRDVASWDAQAISYDVMGVRGCPFHCSFCIHNIARRDAAGLGSYVRRRSVRHVMDELKQAVAARPKLRTVAFSDDIFAPPRPWLEEFCSVYPREIGLPFIIYSFPRMVDEKRVAMLRRAGLWATTMGIQSGSERVRRECYDRETSTESIVEACRLFKRFGVILNLDFIGDNPYETDDERLETLDLLCRLPKPFYFNYFSLAYFPGVDLTVRALRDGIIAPADVEHIAQRGYRYYGGHLMHSRTEEELYWDVAFGMAVHGFPKATILPLMRTAYYRQNLRFLAHQMRRVRTIAYAKTRVVDYLARRPNLAYQFWADGARVETPIEVAAAPAFEYSPASAG
ncbi:B12-binding domain-containing radical SAM protein [Candidatus Binatia bacterium]|nr:B12-binding domain-containing radical SAM protein [Candidatus Binatia bacterium]